MNNVHLRYGEKIPRFFRIVCAIMNCFYSTGFTESQRNIEFAIQARLRSAHEKNQFQEYLEENDFVRLSRRWKRADCSLVNDFPKLSLNDIEKITLGTFQIRIAKKYICEHLDKAGRFEIWIAEGQEGFVRAQIHSRFSSTKHHHVFIKYDSTVHTVDSISGYYCTCKAGSRVVGCCSHVATVRYFSVQIYMDG